MTKITARQLIIFYCIYSFSIKFLTLPQILSQGSGRDAWIAALLGTVLELALLFLTLKVLENGKGSDIYSDFRANTTFIGAKAFAIVLFSIFFFQLFILANTSFTLLSDSLFAELNKHLFIIPLVLFGTLFCFSQAQAIFRSGEIFYLLIILGLVLSVIPVIGQIRPSEVTPILSNGFMPVLNTTYNNLIYFESTALLLVFSGDIKMEKKFKRNFMTVASIVGLFFVLFVFMFYALFGPLAPTKTMAVANLSTYSSFLTQGGRLDWILICIWLLLLLLRFGITFYCAFASIRYIFNIKHRAGYISFSLALAVYLLFIFIFVYDSRLQGLIATLAPAVAALFFLVPLTAFINSTILKRRKPGDVKEKLTNPA